MKWLERHYRTIGLVWTVLFVAIWLFRPAVPYLKEAIFAAWIALVILWLVLTLRSPGFLESRPGYTRLLGRLRERAWKCGERGQYRAGYLELVIVEAAGWQDAWSVGCRGFLAESAGWIEKAKDLYKKALSLDPSESEARGRLILLLAEDGALEEAASYAEPVSVLKDVDPAAILWLAKALLAKDPSKALSLCRMTAQRGEPSAVICEAGVLLELDRLDEALTIYRRAFKESRDPVIRMQGRQGIACVYGAQRRFSEALDVAEDALRLAREIPSDADGAKPYVDDVQDTIAWLNEQVSAAS